MTPKGRASGPALCRLYAREIRNGPFARYVIIIYQIIGTKLEFVALRRATIRESAPSHRAFCYNYVSHYAKGDSASMEKTQNYQLSQWSMEDRIQMEDFNADNAIIETALTGLERRKLELVKVFDVTETLSEKSFWPIDVSQMHPENCTALFFFFNMPNSTSYGLALGNGTGTHIGYIYGSKAGIMAWSVHIPEMPITFIPIGNVQDFTNRTGYTFKDFKTLSLCPPSLNGKLNGTYRCQGLIIP